MKTVEKQKDNRIGTEILEATIELSVSNSSDYKRENDLAIKVENFIKKLNVDVERTWNSLDSTPKFIAESILAEAGELFGEFTKEQRKNTDRTHEIGLEIVDTLYFIVKFIDKTRLNIKSNWRNMDFQFARYEINSEFGASSDKELSRFVMDKILHLNDSLEHDFSGSGETAIFLSFAALLQIAEKRNIDVEKMWAEKITSKSIAKDVKVRK